MNKILTIIISLLILAAVIFFIAGLVKPTVEYTTQITVTQGLQKTWNEFNDIEKIYKWIPEVKKVEVLSGIPGDQGVQYEMTIDNQGKKTIMTETLVELKPLELVKLEFDAGNMIKEDTYTFSSEGNLTNINGTHICRGSNYLYRCIFAFFGGAFKSIDQNYMDQFKTWAESAESG